MNRDRCSICDSWEFEVVIDLGHHPLADRFLYSDDLAKEETYYPLKVRLCVKCGYAGIDFLVPAEERYQQHDYSYTSGNSPVSVAHFQDLAESIAAIAHPGRNDLVVDIGSNDGTLLNAIRRISGCSVIGVEPSPNIAAVAERAGVRTMPRLFDVQTAEAVKEEGRPLVVVTTNVLNHANDVRSFVATVEGLLRPDGCFVFEVPYLAELIQRRAFDTIYLEHVSYFGIKPLRRLLGDYGMRIVRVEVIEYMGGSLRVFAARRQSEAREVAELMDGERRAGYDQPGVFDIFMKDVSSMKLRVCRSVYDARERGERVLGIGAATKGNTFLNYCRLDSSVVDFVTDSSPLKIGKFLPGSHIPIRSDESIPRGYGYALILPWNIAGFLMQKLQHLDLKFITRD